MPTLNERKVYEQPKHFQTLPKEQDLLSIKNAIYLLKIANILLFIINLFYFLYYIFTITKNVLAFLASFKQCNGFF